MHNVLSIVSQKGGVGKSTVTTLLANIFYFHFKYKIAVIDADFPQYSIYKRRTKELTVIGQSTRLKNEYDKLYTDFEPYPIFNAQLDSCVDLIEEIKNDYDFIFVDITGSINQDDILKFFSLSIIFIPVLQDNFSSESALELYNLIEGVIKDKSVEYRSCKLFFNRVPAMNKLVHLRKKFSDDYEIMDEVLNSFTIYERIYRSTVFKIKMKKDKPLLGLVRFANAIRKEMEASNQLSASVLELS